MHSFIQTALFLGLMGCLPKTPTPAQLPDTQLSFRLSVLQDDGSSVAASAELQEAALATFGAHSLASGTKSVSVNLTLDAHFFSRIQGQQRWVITGSVTLTGNTLALTETVNFPVFLQHAHQGEEAALRAGLPLLERQIDGMLRRATPQEQ